METVYRTFDGKIFTTAKAARSHEDQLNNYTVYVTATVTYKLHFKAEDVSDVEQKIIDDNGDLLDENAEMREYEITSAFAEGDDIEDTVDLKIR